MRTASVPVLVSIILDGCFCCSFRNTFRCRRMGPGGRTQHSLVCSMAEKTWWLARGQLYLSAAAATSFVIFSLFGREAEEAGLSPSRRVGVGTKKLMNQHIQQWRKSRSPTQYLSFSKVSTNSFSFSFSQQPTSHVPRLFCHASLSTVPLPFPLAPLVVEEVLVLLFEWIMEEEVAGAAMSNSDAKCPGGGRRRALSPSDDVFSPSYELRTSPRGFLVFHD
ncbi:hypothetical protein GWK47_015691 [Chionoecetes opilio]|uniref:Uncharacterized protein n=1 Tax=Chionoecetes opilio TaxID=41210 RepID=A0A8J5CI80_CHIOP|nr:hypothetical protein GWK47_015691 [Chionoecetes opilio]